MLSNLTTLGVITLPVLAPVAALLQLLFPGLLRDQWKQYRVAIIVLLTQSTVFMLHWALVTWWVKDRVWWLSDAALTFAIVLVALIGLIVAAFMAHRRVKLTHRRLAAYHAGQMRAAARTPLPPREGPGEGRVSKSVEVSRVNDDPPQQALPDQPNANPNPVAVNAPEPARSHVTAAPTLPLPLPKREGSAIHPCHNAIYIPPVPTIHPLAANPVDRPPAKVEYLALGIFAALGILWALYQVANSASPFDQVASVTAACGFALLHLVYRKLRAARKPQRPIRASTELVFLLALVISGTGLGVYLNQADPDNLAVDRVVTDWPTYRGNKHRTGVIDGSSAPQKPRLLWTFDPSEQLKKGRYMFHSTPTVVEGLLYVGVLHEIQSSAYGYLYCINAADDRPRTDAASPASGQPRATMKAGEVIWKFTGASLPGGAAKAIFCAPTIHAGTVYVGEGYHEDIDCRLFALDGGTGQSQWMIRTKSHTESPPTIVASRIYFGAGDDGLFCYDMKNMVPAGDGKPASPPSPKLLWQAKELHIDGAPCVADGRVFVGTVIGDVHAGLAMLALDADTGDVVWKIDSPLPVPGCAAHSGGRVYFGLGNGKLGVEPENPQGAVWCLDAKTGEKKWTFATRSGVFACPAIAHGRCYVTSLDSHLYCLDEATGELIWKEDTGGPIVAAPVVTDDDVVIVTISGIVKCFAAQDGAARWTFDDKAVRAESHDVYGSPTLSAGRLYIAAGGKVHCIGDR